MENNHIKTIKVDNKNVCIGMYVCTYMFSYIHICFSKLTELFLYCPHHQNTGKNNDKNLILKSHKVCAFFIKDNQMII